MTASIVIRSRPASGGAGRSESAAITTDPDLIAAYLDDASGRTDGAASAVARPESVDGVAAAVRSAIERGWTVLPQAGRSSLTGGAVPSQGLVLSVERLSRIGAIREDGSSGTVRVGAGVRLDALASVVDRAGWFFPPIPTYRQAMIGGTVSTNAGGPVGFKYGPTRDWIRGVSVVLASGERIELERGRDLVPRGGSFYIEAADGRRITVPTPDHRLPRLHKLSAGYHADDPLDLVDLFVGAEGTLGVIVDVTVALAPRPPAVLAAWVFGRRQTDVRGLSTTLHDAARRASDPTAPDVRAIEWLDARGVSRLQACGAPRRLGVAMPAETDDALYVELELPAAVSEDEVIEVVERAMQPQSTAGPAASSTIAPSAARVLERWCAMLADHGALDRFEFALDDRPRRLAAFAALREALPLAINEELAERHPGRPPQRKSGGDMVVPFDRVWELADRCRTELDARGLDGMIWGHLADGNLHPNVVPRDAAEAAAADAFQLELGRVAMRLGGAPLAEHGVGRHEVKRQLLASFVGRDAIDRMQQIKRALDPTWRLAPGVLFDVPGRDRAPESPRRV